MIGGIATLALIGIILGLARQIGRDLDRQRSDYDAARTN